MSFFKEKKNTTNNASRKGRYRNLKRQLILVGYLKGESVHISAEGDDWWVAGADLGEDAGASVREGVGYAEAVEVEPDKGAGVMLLEAEFGLLVDPPPDGDQPFLLLVGRSQQVLCIVAERRGRIQAEAEEEREEEEETTDKQISHLTSNQQ